MAAKKKTAREKPSPEAPQLPMMRLKEFLQIFHDTNEYAPDNAFCFIIGSGASYVAGIPTGATLVNRWLVEMHDMDDACQKRILPSHAKIEDYADALMEGETDRLKIWAEKRFEDLPGFKFEERAKFYGHIYKARFAEDPGLGQKFLRALIHRRKPSIGFHLLARVLNRSRHNVVITTNFDHLVEDAIAITEHEAIQSFNHTGLAGFVRSRGKQPAVAKIHGDILLQTFNAADELESLSDEWQDALRTLFRTYTPIVIGYGGNDPGFMSFLQNELKSWSADRRCYWFVRQQSSFLKIPDCTDLTGIPSLRVVECPGFTELMVKLDEILDFVPLDKELRERTEEIANALSAAHDKARGEVAEHDRKLRDSLRLAAGGSSVEGASSPTAEKGPDNGTFLWEDWRDRISGASVAQEKKKLIVAARKAFPESLPLQSFILFDELRNGPRDLAKIEAIRKLLHQLETKYGPEHPETLAALHYLGTAELVSGESEKAEATLRRVIASRELVLGPEHREVLTSRNNLALALGNQGKPAEAEKEHRAVRETRERVLGPEHPDTLASRINLGTALNSQGKHAEAEKEYRAVLAIQERVLGPERPDTLRSRLNLAGALYSQGNYAETKREENAVLDIQERTLSPEHPDVFISCYNLSITLEQTGEKSEALEYARRALAGRRKVLGEQHPQTQRAKRRVERLEGE